LVGWVRKMDELKTYTKQQIMVVLDCAEQEIFDILCKDDGNYYYKATKIKDMLQETFK
jgi:hypothetical protein